MNDSNPTHNSNNNLKKIMKEDTETNNSQLCIWARDEVATDDEKRCVSTGFAAYRQYFTISFLDYIPTNFCIIVK